MKKYGDYERASISMSKDQEFIDAINDLFRTQKITHILESGTFVGTGSTTTLANAIIKNELPVKSFRTVEVDFKIYKKAKKNLAPFSFVTPTWGMTIKLEEALDFIESDEAINNHHSYPEIFIDNIEDPKSFYKNELSGQLSKHHFRQNLGQRIISTLKQNQETFEEEVFEKYLNPIKAENPLILLDSAGGIGFLEFQTVLKIMDGNPFWLILDDIHHLKHFRSYQQVKQDPQFEILAENAADGWVIARKHSLS